LKQRDEEAAKIAALQAENAREVDDLSKEQDAAQQQFRRERIARRNAEIQATQERERALREAAERRRKEPVRIKGCPPNDPLCGIN
jgi:hypothetical protein